MGRLAGFKYRQIIKHLKRFNFEFHRQAAGGHEICFSSTKEGTLRAILKQADISPEEFLEKNENKLKNNTDNIET